MSHVILGSGSKRRTELLAAAGIEHSILKPSDRLEAQWSARWAFLSPARLVRRLAILKALDVAACYHDQQSAIDSVASNRRAPEVVIISADTVVEFQGRCLGKPRSAEHAVTMLLELSGQQHDILTGVVVYNLRNARLVSGVARSTVLMAKLDLAFIEDYVAAGFASGKAGSYGIQDVLMRSKVTLQTGEFDNVVGLPVSLTETLLSESR